MANPAIEGGGDVQPRHAWRWFRNAVLDSRYVADPEWLIGLGRLVTAAFAVIAIYFDPTQPGRLADEARLITLVYLAFALLALVPIRQSVDSRFHLLTHGIDIIVIGSLLHLTDDLTSPFFAFFHFMLLAATIRWGVTGALLGALVLETMLLVIGMPDLEDGVSELNVMIMRSAYFLVAAFMLGYFGAYRNRSRHRLARLAAWPPVQSGLREDAWLSDILDHARDVLGAARLVVIWQDDEPTSTIAISSADGMIVSTLLKPSQWALIKGNLRSREPHAVSRQAALIAGLNTAFGDAHPIDIPINNLCDAAFSGLRYKGRLLVLNAKYPHEEIESLAEIVAGRISYELDRLALIREIAVNIRVQERVRLARDLHDSVLQDLTAARLKLKSAMRSAPGIERPLSDVATIIADQQRRIRHFADGMRSGGEDARSPNALARHVAQLERQWDCEIHLTTHPDDLRVSGEMSGNLIQIISEATSNAVRHGKATRIDLALTLRGGTLQIAIADNGTGIVDKAAGEPRRPLSLGERVTDLAGRLSVVRYQPGFALLIELPST